MCVCECECVSVCVFVHKRQQKRKNSNQVWVSTWQLPHIHICIVAQLAPAATDDRLNFLQNCVFIRCKAEAFVSFILVRRRRRFCHLSLNWMHGCCEWTTRSVCMYVLRSIVSRRHCVVHVWLLTTIRWHPDAHTHDSRTHTCEWKLFHIMRIVKPQWEGILQSAVASPITSLSLALASALAVKGK